MNNNYIFQLEELLRVGAMTQTQLAQRLGVTFAALNRWLKGHSAPHPRRKEAILALYKEIVGHPSATEARVNQAVRAAKALRRKRLGDMIVGTPALQEELILEHTYNSTSIEGTTFTRRQTEGVIFNKSIFPDKTLTEHLEVTNHAVVLRTLLQKQIQAPLTEAVIKHIHECLLQGIREDAGRYSKNPRAIRGVDIALTHPKDIPEKMHSLLKQWNRLPKQKTLKEIAEFHVNFELIHPFGDGNGRTGRLLMILHCLAEDYPPVVIENSKKIEYYEVLEYAQKKSSGPFICFLAEEMDRTAALIKRYKPE